MRSSVWFSSWRAMQERWGGKGGAASEGRNQDRRLSASRKQGCSAPDAPPSPAALDTAHRPTHLQLGARLEARAIGVVYCDVVVADAVHVWGRGARLLPEAARDVGLVGVGQARAGVLQHGLNEEAA